MFYLKIIPSEILKGINWLSLNRDLSELNRAIERGD
jgi:hypothetical protein